MSESPALLSAGLYRGRAFELKFVIDEVLAERVQAWGRERLSPDPHGEASLAGGYRTTTIFLDTPELDVYYRTRWYRRRKLRVRRYGQNPWVFIERKSKRGDRVVKRRTTLPETDLARLLQSSAGGDAHRVHDTHGAQAWDGEWFQRLMQLRRLQPACRVSYLRMAHVGECADGPLRLTLDRDIRGVLAPNDWRLVPCDHGLPLLPDRVILELKFLSALPGPFKELVRQFAINPAIVSKYRACREAWGLTAASGEVACA